jgi:HemK-related putative methylase
MQMEPAEALIKPRHYGAARVALGRALYWYYRLFHKQRLDGFGIERIEGVPVLVAPGVLNPRLTRSGEFFASVLGELVAPGAEVLDMGTGSGVCALFAARHARRVVAVDINPAAVRCARINILMNRLEDTVEVVQGDLFAPLAGRRFDLVLFNPPFLRGVPRDDADRAWRSTDVAERFAAGLRDHLQPGGSALILLSTYGEASYFVSEFQRRGFAIQIVRERDYFNEKMTILRLT